MNSHSVYVVLGVIACFLDNSQNNAVGLASNKGNAVTNSAEFLIAVSSVKSHEERLISALKLNIQDRVTLQESLLSRLPDNYTMKEHDDLIILAEIGDEQAAKTIEHIIALDRENDILVPGKINSIRHYAIKKIRERPPTKSFSLF